MVPNWLKEERNIDIVFAVIRIIVIVGIFVTLASCGAQYHLKRAIAKDPNIANDTIVRIDTAVVTEEKVVSDTLVIHDTVVREIRNDGVVVRLQKIHDTIMVEAICESDTIEIVKEVEVVRVIQQQKSSIFTEANLLIRSLIALIAAVIMFLIINRYFVKH